MSNYVNLMDIIYPVGSIYQSMDSTSPASMFGGTWSAINTFLYGSTSAGNTGGEATHTLTINEMPKHKHMARIAITNGGNATTYRSLFATNSNFWGKGNTFDGAKGYDDNNMSSPTGGGKHTTTCPHTQPVSSGKGLRSSVKGKLRSSKEGGVACLITLTSWMLSTQLGQYIT